MFSVISFFTPYKKMGRVIYCSFPIEVSGYFILPPLQGEGWGGDGVDRAPKIR